MSHHLQSEHLSEEMRACIENCSDCHDTCVETLVHCLGIGGEHASLEHVRVLLDCADSCDTSRDFMLRGSALHARFCGACAEACERCADSCERLGADDDVMRNCAETCRRCAESCRAMSA